MFGNIMRIKNRLGMISAAAALAAVVGVASSAAAYETGYGPVQLVSVSETSASLCPSPDAAALIKDAYAPQYPQIALEMGLEGTSLVTFTMALDGNVSNVNLAGTSGNRLFDRAAVDAVKKSRFTPATENCSKIGGDYGVSVAFAKSHAPSWSVSIPFARSMGRIVTK